MKSIFLIIVMFLLTQLIGLYVGIQYTQAINAGLASPALSNPDSIETSFYLFGNIIVSTIVILILIRFKRWTIRILEAFIVFTASWITFDFIFPLDVWFLSLGFFMAVALTVWKAFRPNILNQDIAAVASGAGVGALLGVSLGVMPAIVFMLILSIYDFISVFITKHMVYMAKALTERPTAFTIAAPPSFKQMTYVPAKKSSKKKVHIFQLGVGDMVMPLMFAVSVLGRFSIINSLGAIIGSTVALMTLIYFMRKNPQPLPALPFITFGTLAGFLLTLLI